MKLAFLTILALLAPFASAQYLTYDPNTGDVQIVSQGRDLDLVLVNSDAQTFIAGAAKFSSLSDPQFNSDTAQQLAMFAIDDPPLVFGDWDFGIGTAQTGLTTDFLTNDWHGEYQVDGDPGVTPLPIVVVDTPEPFATFPLAALLLLRRRKS